MRAHCRSICGEMHSGFVSLRQALPMNIKAEIRPLQDLVEGQGRHRADQDDLARVPRGLRRPVPVRQDRHGGRDVRPRRQPLPHLRRRARRRTQGLRRPDLGLARDAGMARRGAGRRRRRSRSWRSSSRPSYASRHSRGRSRPTRRASRCGAFAGRLFELRGRSKPGVASKGGEHPRNHPADCGRHFVLVHPLER